MFHSHIMFRSHMNKSVMFKYVWQVARRYFAGKLMRLCIIALTIFGGHIIPATAAPLIQKIGAPLSHPWGMDFLDERHLFVTERSGNLYLVDLFTGTRNSIGNLPAIAAAQQGGLLDVAVFANQDSQEKDDAIIYLCYSLKIGSQTVTAIDRAGFDGTNLTNRQTIFQANAALFLIKPIYMPALVTVVIAMTHKTHHVMQGQLSGCYMMAVSPPTIQNRPAGHQNCFPKAIAIHKALPSIQKLASFGHMNMGHAAAMKSTSFRQDRIMAGQKSAMAKNMVAAALVAAKKHPA
jgi:hypothetical protein